jgi:hypothetical protein
MHRVVRLAAGALLLSAVWAGAAPAGEGPTAESPTVSISRSIPDLHLSINEVPGETSVRWPLGSENYLLYGLLSPFVSLGSSTTLGVPWNATLPPGLRRDADGLDDLRLGAGMALPLSERAQLYGGYRFLRGRIDSSLGRSLLHREPDAADFRAGFSIRLD